MPAFLSGRFLHLTLFVMILMMGNAAFAANDGVTFESFYKADFSVSWLVNGLAAVLVGLLVLWGMPILAPSIMAAIGSIGTTVGGVFGFSGVAATNFGLALLGGGAVASGGFGVVGGTALLAAALTFGTDVTLDYAIGALSQKYDQNKFAEASLKMMTLPLPVNTSGSASVREAGEALKPTFGGDAWHCVNQYPDSIADFKSCLALVGKTQNARIGQALARMHSKRNTNSIATLERDAAMISLLEFLSNDYLSAQKSALLSYELARKNKGQPTLPAFVYASSLLYNEVPDFNESFDKFKYAVIGEPKNALTPVLFATYLDRLTYRLNDRAAGVDQIARLSRFAASLPNDQRKLAIQQTLLSHIFMRIKVAQQNVLALVRTQNASIRNKPQTLTIVKAAFQDYEQLLTMSTDLIPRQGDLLDVLANDNSWWESVKQGKNPLKKSGQALVEQRWPNALMKFQHAFISYHQGKAALQAEINSFERELRENLKAPSDQAAD